MSQYKVTRYDDKLSKLLLTFGQLFQLEAITPCFYRLEEKDSSHVRLHE